MTTQEEIVKVQLIVNELNEVLKNEFEFVDSVQINDWGDFGNFSIFINIGLQYKYRGGLYGKGVAQRIKGICNRKFKEYGGILRDIYFPEAVYITSYGINSFHFYRSNYISIDLDFRVYNKQTNSFN